MSKFFRELNDIFRNHPTDNNEYEDECIEATDKTDTKTQFFRSQKNQLIDLKENMERF